MSDHIRTVIAAVKKLAQMDPQDAAVDATVEALHGDVALIGEQMREATPGFGKDSMKDDIGFINDQIKKLQTAAATPARNYQRITAILAGLSRAAQAASQPRYAALRPQIATIVAKVAGVFSEVDTVQDLDKPLEAIEKAVHSLYGPSQSKNDAYMFERRNKGHHSGE